jgi:hypothetical protein
MSVDVARALTADAADAAGALVQIQNALTLLMHNRFS